MQQTANIDIPASHLVLETDGVTTAPIVPRNTYAIHDKKILVFDDIFDEQFVDNFGIFLLRRDYQFRPSINNELSNGLSAELLESLPALPHAMEGILQHYYPQMTKAPAPQSISHGYIAALRFGDSATVHQDTQCDDCVTFLYYGNLSWNGEWGGETVFYDDEMSAAACVTPRPGRLVLFNSVLHHRAGTPIRECPTFRYGLSVFYRCERMMHNDKPLNTAATQG
jgi:hypothetical protein